jgi:hypothetical protein
MKTSRQEKVQEILTQNDLDFRIEKLPLFAKLPVQAVSETGEIVTSLQDVETNSYGLYNDKTGEIIYTCKEGYVVSQNDEVVDLVLQGMESFGQLSVNRAYSLDGGKKTFLQLAIDGTAKVGDDDIKQYVTIIDSNDGSSGLMVGVGDFTFSCKNQFYRIADDKKEILRHSASLTEKLQRLPLMIGDALGDSMRLLETYRKLASTPLTANLADELVKYVIGHDRTMLGSDEISTRTNNIIESVYSHIDKEIAQKGKNLWGLHSGITSWTTHDKSAPRRNNGRLESSLVGTNSKTNLKSLEFVESLI